jgi:UDP-N-acetylglucosamine 2-epimerase (non-hydrolysing)
VSARIDRRRLMIVLGTRPEAIKLAPVILEARSAADRFDVRVVTTGQHRQMLDQALALFGIDADVDLDIMSHDQDLRHVTTQALDGLYGLMTEHRPDCVIVQGDTTTAFVGALAAFYHRLPVAHVEAGLRSYDRYQPFPEEINRRLISQIAEYHFAPTESARSNLLAEGIDKDRIWVTGNTGIDALLLAIERYGGGPGRDRSGRMLLLTAHRRENHGEPLRRICRAVLRLLAMFPDLRVVFPVHLSPRVRATVLPLLAAHPRVELREPLDYREFILAMDEAYLVLTDSGGVQEEAPSLHKPVLVLREKTERSEAIEAGSAFLVGTDEDTIVNETALLLRTRERYERAASVSNPYGDGQASPRILAVLAQSARARGECPLLDDVHLWGR